MRNLTLIKTEPGKSSYAWTKKKSVVRVVFNWLLCRVADLVPFSQKKLALYRLMGVKIGKNVQIMPNVFLDIFFPELIEIGDNVVIGLDAFISCHEFNPTEFRYGPISIGSNSLIGARSFILPGVKIGDNSLVGAMTVVTHDVPNNVIAYGSPMQFKEVKPTQ